MNSKVGHIFLYVADLEKSHQFYKTVLEALGYRQVVKTGINAAFNNAGTSIWLEKAPEDRISEGYHRRRVGLNHLCWRVNSKEEVDKFAEEIVKPLGAKVLYDTPKPFPEYEEGYYGVFFEEPDGIKLEVSYYP